eukprot:9503367-Pyramimonas_sp.AAC.1
MRLVLPATAAVKAPEAWPSKENVAIQDGLECAAHVCHYPEEAVRMCFQEGPASAPRRDNGRARAAKEKMRG